MAMTRKPSSSVRSTRARMATMESSMSVVDTDAYVCGKTMASTDPSRSSTVAMAQADPFLVVLRCTFVSRPATVTTVDSNDSSAIRDAIETSEMFARA